MNYLILGINGHVVAINKDDGNELWRKKLKSGSITVVNSDNTKVYASSGGHLFCLDKASGEQLWTNSLKGLGYGTCIIDVGHQAEAVSGTVAANAATSAATAAATTAAIAASGSVAAGDGS